MTNKYTQDMTGTGDHVTLPEEPKKIYESPYGGKTVYERNFGETERRLVDDDPEPETSPGRNCNPMMRRSL